MTNEKEKPTPRQLAKVLRIMLGPEEEWDDAAAELVLEVHGLDSSEAPVRLANLIEREINSRKERGEEIPSGFGEVLSRLRGAHEVTAGSREAKDRIEQMFIVGKVPVNSASTPLSQAFHRRTRKLMEEDEEILNELASELMSDSRGDE